MKHKLYAWFIKADSWYVTIANLGGFIFFCMFIWALVFGEASVP